MKANVSENLTLQVRRLINAPRERVFQAWTTPEDIAKWFGPEPVRALSAKVDLRVGGKFRIQQEKPDGEFFTAAGTYLEVKPPERLVFSWDWEKDGSGVEFGELEGNETRVIVEFHARGDQTEVILTHEKFISIESRDRHTEGWQTCLARLAKSIDAK